MFCTVNWTEDKLFSIIRCSAIVTPRKEFKEYSIGDLITARYQGGGKFPAKIVDINEKKDVLEARLDSVIKSTLQSSDAANSSVGQSEKQTTVDGGEKVGNEDAEPDQIILPNPSADSSLNETAEEWEDEAVNGIADSLQSTPGDSSLNETAEEWEDEAVNGIADSLLSVSTPRGSPVVVAMDEEVDLTEKGTETAEPHLQLSPSCAGSVVTLLKDIPESIHTRCEKRLATLEEDLKRLRKKVKRVEEKLNGQQQQQPQEDEQLLTAIEHLTSPQDIVKTLALKMFSKEDLITKSISGKRSHKSVAEPRPPLDNSKLIKMKHIAQKKGVDHRNFMDKLQNIQKVLRRK